MATPIIEDFEVRQAKVAPVGDLLREKFGALEWQPIMTPMDELVSCILSQNTNDTNRDRGFSALKARFPTWQAVMDAPAEAVIDAIRPAGLANQKGPRIQKVLATIKAERGEFEIDFLKEMPLDDAKQWLIDLDGVGPKTAAIVLCFAFGLPAFPVDTHVHRVGKRIGFLPEKISADKAHPVMEALILPEKHYEFHLHLIYHGRQTCKARKPMCDECIIRQHCDYGSRLAAESEDATPSHNDDTSTGEA